MFHHEKKLFHPVAVERPNPQYAVLLQEQLGGGNGELKAAMQYMSQSFRIKDQRIKDLFLDIAAEELGHMEMVASIVYQLTRNLTPDEIRAGGFDKYYVEHGAAIYPASASGVPFNATAFASKEDALASIHEDLAADAAIIKEQPLREKSRKPLKYKAFSHLGKTPGNRIPAII